MQSMQAKDSEAHLEAGHAVNQNHAVANVLIKMVGMAEVRART